jgi:methylthioribulose-1-phosphate dehydratase
MTTSRLPTLAQAATGLAALGRRFYERGWVLGTSGNFSAVLSRRPLRLAITASSVHKGTLSRRQILEIDDRARVRPASAGRSSAETLLHLEILKLRDAGAILHTHSVWSTILSDLHASAGGLAIQGFEMLKGLDGVTTHEHREWVPVVENDQDMTRLAANVRRVLGEHSSAHAFLIRRHGLYTWGRTIADAERQVEIFEFLFEVMGKENRHGFGENSIRGSDDSRRR